MLTIKTSDEFREVASRVVLRAEDLIPEREPKGHWRLPSLPSPQERNEQSQNLVNLFKRYYEHPIILDHYREKGQRLSRIHRDKWSFLTNHFYVKANQVVAMIVLRDPETIHHHHDNDDKITTEREFLPSCETKAPETPQTVHMSNVNEVSRSPEEPETSKGVKAPIPTGMTQAPVQILVSKIREERRVAILKSRRPPTIDPFDLPVGDILVLEGGKEGLFVGAGSVTGNFTPYEIEREAEGAQNPEETLAEAA
ncbi:hypothetical protein LTR99_011076 [Exophiala xenobiotica]|uniref:Uncharacterized protein n=1 Tax=Vermiconidia calcicola TaxID=1690605 RepID=A0AAV9PQ24_9PEZI|nr:hypothetical protein LTR99_011076 [Exophiala xenobiotica]KAK5401651.1 hypothetical protein LTR06_011015 [Exophiala xenobiotica]KAK5425469.1 hypothetical protein LTR34_011077 [Exophiala xenobiotica]KAK5527598.1 hypothetical protein LTR25_011047 [Vermiconidia calcicola]KAK5529040.1 hypothetical protein LTR23_010840 [Chaetothyriales sp. CCFEE 6169]